MNLMYNRQNQTWPDLDDIKRQLQDAEIDFNRKKKSNNNHDKDEKKQKEKEKAKDQKDGVKCPVEGCKGYNHTEEQCFVKNPNLKPEWMKLKEKERAQKQAKGPNKTATFVFNPDEDVLQ